jgi:DNA repair protein RadC
LAKVILARFGSFAEAMNAPEERLREVSGLGEAARRALRLMRGEVLERPVLASWSQVLDYCRASMGFEAKEQFRILFSMLSFAFLLRALHATSLMRPPCVLHALFSSA